jgi:D-alanine-D-alanine ligase
VRDEKEWVVALELAFRYSKEILVEKFIEGKLLAIGMNGEQPMPIVHIRPKSGFYDYESKYTSGRTEYACPAELSIEETQRCEDIAIKVYRVLRGNGMPRVDVILDAEGIPYVLEMNTIPGMTPTSLLPMAAKQFGMEFDDLVFEILKSAQLDYEG